MWIFLFGKGSLAQSKEARPRANIPGPTFQPATAVEDGPCPLDPTVLSTPQGGQTLQPLCFHHSGWSQSPNGARQWLKDPLQPP